MAPTSRIGLLIAAFLLGGCSGSLGDALGFGKRAPDEFAVVKRQPLIIPPDYNLRPPDPNAAPPLPRRADAQARATLTGQPVGAGAQAASGAAVGGGSDGEAILVRRTAEVASDPAIRERIARETGGPAPVDAALFEEVINAPDGAAAGAPVSTRDVLTAPEAAAGSETPTVTGRISTPLEDL